MEQRRIALVTGSFYPAVDGATTTVRNLADHLIDAGHQILVMAPGPGLTTYRRSPVARIRPLGKPGRQVREALDAFRPDVVYTFTSDTLGRKALKHGRAAGAATYAVQQAPLRELSSDYWLATVAARADLVITTCAWLSSELADLGVDAPVWRPGVDGRAFTPRLRDAHLHDTWARSRTHPEGRVVVGYVGSLHKRHGVRRLVELGQVPGVRPVLIGGGPQRDWLAARLPEARLTGALGTGDLAVAMASLDVLVHPGEQLTCAHALREAAASGIPVVAPRAGGAAEVVRNLETGVLYEPRDPRGLVDAMTSIVQDQQRGLLGEHARRGALARSWRDAAEELFALTSPHRTTESPTLAA